MYPVGGITVCGVHDGNDIDTGDMAASGILQMSAIIDSYAISISSTALNPTCGWVLAWWLNDCGTGFPPLEVPIDLAITGTFAPLEGEDGGGGDWPAGRSESSPLLSHGWLAASCLWSYRGNQPHFFFLSVQQNLTYIDASNGDHRPGESLAI
jgi:hypothetical protein